MAKSKFKKITQKVHLWIGLITGVVVLLVSLSGAIFVFNEELFEIIHEDVVYNDSPQKEVLPISQLTEIAQGYLGDSCTFKFIGTYRDPSKNWLFNTVKYNRGTELYFPAVKYNRTVYINPKTGAIEGEINNKYEFFRLVMIFHYNFWLGEVGAQIVSWSVLLFVVSLISGIIIWWPKNWKNFKASIKIKRTKNKKRVNYDLHRSTGFYSFPLALIIAITGLVMSFDWVGDFLYWAVTFESHEHKREKWTSTPSESGTSNPFDLAFRQSWDQFSDAHSIYFYPPKPKDTAGLYYNWVQLDEKVYYNSFEQGYDQYSGELLMTQSFEQKNRGEKLLDMNYDIHVGKILGMPGKILAFITSLICALLPVTGFYIWKGRKYK